MAGFGRLATLLGQEPGIRGNESEQDGRETDPEGKARLALHGCFIVPV